MRNQITQAINWAMVNRLMLKSSSMAAKHAPFALSPSVIDRSHFEIMQQASISFGKLIHAISEDHQYLHELIEPLVDGDPFFASLLEMQTAIHGNNLARRLPLLIMRTDYMEDAKLGPKVIEFNGIAAGMGPFGEKVHQLHQYLRQLGDTQTLQSAITLQQNRATHNLAFGIANAAKQIKAEFSDGGNPRVIFVVQSDEDNIFDQYLLEEQILGLGVEVNRKTFTELSKELKSGESDRLLLGRKPIDALYLRAGYQYSDYVATDAEEEECCRMIKDTRIFVEKHRVAINATVSQQLATSKRAQFAITNATEQEMMKFGLSKQEIDSLSSVLAPILPITEDLLEKTDYQEWVLKNQGEGGGHCIFDDKIPEKLKSLNKSEYPIWSLMQRIRPNPRDGSVLIARNGEQEEVAELISEYGMFTVHIDGLPAGDGFAGYLVRSKSIEIEEGGVHSGSGVLDSIALRND